MSLIQAVKRSWRYFLPEPFHSPRRYLRRWYVPLFFYAIGLFTGMYVHPAEPQRITYWALGTFSILLVIKWWTKAPARPADISCDG